MAARRAITTMDDVLEVEELNTEQRAMQQPLDHLIYIYIYIYKGVRPGALLTASDRVSQSRISFRMSVRAYSITTYLSLPLWPRFAPFGIAIGELWAVATIDHGPELQILSQQTGRRHPPITRMETGAGTAATVFPQSQRWCPTKVVLR